METMLNYENMERNERIAKLYEIRKGIKEANERLNIINLSEGERNHTWKIIKDLKKEKARCLENFEVSEEEIKAIGKQIENQKFIERQAEIERNRKLSKEDLASIKAKLEKEVEDPIYSVIRYSNGKIDQNSLDEIVTTTLQEIMNLYENKEISEEDYEEVLDINNNVIYDFMESKGYVYNNDTNSYAMQDNED